MAPDSPRDSEAMSIPESAPVGSSSGIDSSAAPQDNTFTFYESRDNGQNEISGDQPTEQSNTNDTVPVPFPPLPVFQFGPQPSQPVIPKPKRTQCKNACTNCQKACKRCDDNRPCQRCTRYGTTDTCVDSKRKERKKGLKRGPYKKRDGKGRGSADGESPHPLIHGPAALPFVGPVAYPPGMWSTYAPPGQNGKMEATGYYQPVFALTPVGGPPPQGGEGTSASGGNDSQPFPFGFYPATFISYPGFPYPIPQIPGPIPPGFHFAYPAPGLFAPRPPAVINGNNSSSSSNMPGNSSSAKDTAESNSIGNSKGKDPVNGQVNGAESQSKKPATRKEVE